MNLHSHLKENIDTAGGLMQEFRPASMVRGLPVLVPFPDMLCTCEPPAREDA